MLRKIYRSIHNIASQSYQIISWVPKFGTKSNLIFPLKKQFHSSIFQFKVCNSFSNQKKSQNLKKITKPEMFKAQEEQLLKKSFQQESATYDKAEGWGGKIFLAFGIIGLIGIVIYAQSKISKKETDIDESISGMIKINQNKRIQIGGQWTLIDQNGKPFSTSDLSGSYYLIYFGFTKCPDICPSTLIKLGRVLKLIKKMPECNYLNIKCIFVSCDPDRDTPKRLAQYLKNFDEGIIGVTGLSNEDPQLKNCMKNFKIYANKIPLSNGNYSMDHTTITYLMDDENQYVDHLNPTLSQQEMAKAIVNKILNDDYKKMKRRNGNIQAS